MVGRIIIFALIAALVYLNYTVPKEEDHQAFLLSEIQSEYPIPESMQERIWKKVDYSNFFVASFMKTTEGSTMITYGFLKNVKLVDDEWVEEVKKSLQRQNEYY
ncbi:MAG: hypothetical protein GWN55_16655 [Phycisphaerae bacterium]|nr:hypothetical protein [Gammaproteobacteria bacterium]NIR27679.1 hypothetical protein [Gammaproteobacteria bacterium]NIV02920.1 hypothetical protein [Phycisphaerae bacterium]NIV70520.1 hypothetical protein [Phycisphaerae bacterium]NIY19565.1 hypothetical protein [Gammaproteobacteria bacterium]